MKLNQLPTFPKEKRKAITPEQLYRKEGFNDALQEVGEIELDPREYVELDVEKVAKFIGYDNTIIKIPDERSYLLAEALSNNLKDVLKEGGKN